MVELTLGCGLVGTGDLDAAAALHRRALEIFEEDELLQSDPRVHGWAINGYGWQDDLPGALRVASATVELARRRSAIAELPYALSYLSEYQFWTGRWAEAYASASEGASVSRETGQVSDGIFCLWTLAKIDAGRGKAEDCRRHAGEAATIAAAMGNMREWPAFALGFLELTLGRPEEAVRWLQPVLRLELGQAQNCPLVAPFNLVEAHIRAGDSSRATHALETVERGCAGRPWELAAIERCRGLLQTEPACFEALRASVAQFERLVMPFERARSQLCLGERLRRAGLRRDAREQLHLALATFEELGAEPWAERARKELRASGETLRRRDPAAREQLTPQELQIALVVAEGKTNKEAGAQLFLSPKTIEAHLGRIYRKLAIHSRAELIHLFARESLPHMAGETVLR